MFYYNRLIVRIVDAQQQARTPRDVRGPWVRPRCPNKGGRKGTRRQWKRKHAPHYVYYYREPDDVLILNNRVIIATPLQADALRRSTKAVAGQDLKGRVAAGNMGFPAWPLGPPTLS